MQLVDKAQRELAEQGEAIGGCISIGCGELASVRVLPDLFRSFSGKYPLVTYDLFTADADQIKEKMDAGVIDIGLLLEPVDIDKYDYIRLGMREKWVVLMRPDDPLAEKEAITAKDLSKKPIIMARRSLVQNQLANWFGDYFDRACVLFKSNLATNGAIMVQAGLGYSLVVEGSVPFWDREKICIRPLYPELSATCVLAWKRQQPFGRAAMKFIEHMKNLLGQTAS